jgi:hypothetical protein
VPLSLLLDPVLRIAGITTEPGIIPNAEQYGELVPELNRMMGHFNLNGHRIFTTSIDQYSLFTGQTVYLIGPGGDFDTDRPQRIAAANLITATDPTTRTPLHVAEDPTEWTRISIQELTSDPTGIYYDKSYDGDGRGRIYIHPQGSDGDLLELLTWVRLATSFTAITDVAFFPDGYEDCIVWNLAIRAAMLYPLKSRLHPLAPERAKETLRAIQTSNTRSPRLYSEAADIGGACSASLGRGWLYGYTR